MHIESVQTSHTIHSIKKYKMLYIIWKETLHTFKFLGKIFGYLRFLVFPYYILRALFLFIVGIEVTIGGIVYSLTKLKMPLLIFCIGTFLTPFPSYIVYILMFLPSKRVIPILVLSMVFGFFHAIRI